MLAFFFNKNKTRPPEVQPVLLAVADEGAKLAAVGVVVQRQQETLVELGEHNPRV